MIVLSAAGVVGASVPVLVALRCLGVARAERLVGWVGRVRYAGGPAAGLLGAALLYRRRGRCLAQCLALTAVNQVAVTLLFLGCVHALWDGDADGNPIPPPVAHFLISPLAQLLAAVPVFPGGAGIGEAGYGGLYALFGSPPANGVLGSLVQRGLTVAAAGCGLLAYLALRPRAAAAGAAPTPAARRAA